MLLNAIAIVHVSEFSEWSNEPKSLLVAGRAARTGAAAAAALSTQQTALSNHLTQNF